MIFRKQLFFPREKKLTTNLSSNTCEESLQKDNKKQSISLQKKKNQVINKFPTAPSKPFSSSFPLSHLEINGHVVTYEENLSALEKHLSTDKQKQFQTLLHEAQISPKKTYAKALSWQKNNPSTPESDNLITYLHLQNGEIKKAEELIKASFEQHPNYLFAKINYADQCLRQKKLEEIPHIFPSFQLKDLFPQRKSFHVSEFRGFMVVLSRYYLQIGKKDLALQNYKLAYLADPTHPSLVFLEKKLLPKKIILKLFSVCTKACSYLRNRVQ